MPTRITASEQHAVGTPRAVQGTSPCGTRQAVFEDDGATGYFYAVDVGPKRLIGKRKLLIRDAMHIYNVNEISDAHIPSTINIAWSATNEHAMLLINRFPHAVFDFTAKHGWCRTNFPPADERHGWSRRAWDDACLALFS